MNRDRRAVAAFVTREEARTAYRRAWLQLCLSTELAGWLANSLVMESLQEEAAGDAGEWRAFVESLPGFAELAGGEHWMGVVP